MKTKRFGWMIGLAAVVLAVAGSVFSGASAAQCKEFTRNKDTKKNSFHDVKDKRKTADKNPSQKRKGKFENKEKKISKLRQKKQKSSQPSRRRQIC